MSSGSSFHHHHLHHPTDRDRDRAQDQNQSPPGWHFDSTLTYRDPHAATSFDSSGFFDDAFHVSPPPQPGPSYLDTILNPVETGSFGYHFEADFLNDAMSPSRSGRLSNGYVDLTTNNETPEMARSRRPKRESATPGPSTKRMKRNDGTAAQAKHTSPEATVEEIDLSDDKQPVQDVLQKQREEAVKSQAPPDEPPTTFNTFNCVICMDTPTDLTATACGHLFCHTCLMEALIAGENRGNPGEQRRSQCPVCRKNINRSKASDIIPLLLKKGLATQPRKAKPVTATAPKVQS